MQRLIATVVAAGLLSIGPVHAQQDAANYPNRPVKIIVDVAPGGGVDTATRLVAAKLEQSLGQPFVVENRPGAAGNIGAEVVFTAEPDGYTLLASSPSPLAINQWLYKKLSYDPAGFQPIAMMSRIPNVLVVRKDFPAASVQEAIAYLKANPGKVNMGSGGIGSGNQLTGEMLKMMTGIDLVHVPYRGAGPAMVDLMGGQVQVMFNTMGASLQHVRAGKLRALGVATKTRQAALPDVPTVAEFVPGYEASFWTGIAAPKGTPPAIVEQLNKAVNAGFADANVKARLAEWGATALAGSPADLAKFVADETEKWGKVIRAANIKAE